MSKPSNINEIRIEIDKIDLKILNLISDRKDLVTQVVKFKNKNQTKEALEKLISLKIDDKPIFIITSIENNSIEDFIISDI